MNFRKKTRHLTIMKKKCVSIGTAEFTRFQYTFPNKPKKCVIAIQLIKNKSITKRGEGEAVLHFTFLSTKELRLL